MQNHSSTINKPVFFSSVILIFFITILGAAVPKSLEEVFGNIQHWLNTSASWVYILSVAIALIFATGIIFSKYGSIKLGPDHSVPEYSFASWISMLFSAGMGIGLLFFGVAEPVMHFMSPPVADPQSIQAAREAMVITFFHWGLHAWAIYGVVALCLAYFSFRHDLPLLPRSVLYPLIGQRIYGPLGHAIDTFAVVGTMFGVATSLGFGITQINAGLAYLINVPESIGVQFALIAVITFAATASVVSGLDAGIQRLSNLNMLLAIGLLLTVLLTGPTVLLLNSFVQNVGNYFSSIVPKTFNLYSYDPKEEWIGGWTLLYWGWWVSWSPFVGMFIARISRGRTIKEFMTSVLFVPAGFSFFWMTVFGNTAINAILNEGASDFATAVSENVPVALFKFFELLPVSSVLSVLGVVLIATFFITSSDSGSLVIDTITSGGKDEPPVWQRVFWAVTEGLVAAVLLYAGGLTSLQTMAIISAFPLMVLLIVAIYCLIKELRHDYAMSQVVGEHSSAVQFKQASVHWKDYLASLTKTPSEEEIETYIQNTARSAFSQLIEEMSKNNIDAKMEIKVQEAHFTVFKKDVADFIYSIHLRKYSPSEYLRVSDPVAYRAEVFLAQGGQQYNIYGYSTDQLIADVLHQYEKHLQFLHLSHSEYKEE